MEMRHSVKITGNKVWVYEMTEILIIKLKYDGISVGQLYNKEQFLVEDGMDGSDHGKMVYSQTQETY